MDTDRFLFLLRPNPTDKLVEEEADRLTANLRHALKASTPLGKKYGGTKNARLLS